MRQGIYCNDKSMKWALVDKLKDYMYCEDVIVKTDDNPLTHILTIIKLDAILQGSQTEMLIPCQEYFMALKLPQMSGTN